MTDQITRHIAGRLTKEQKRNAKQTIADAIDIFSDQRLPPVVPRSAQEIHKAQVNLAALALQQEEPEKWLSEVLDALGLRQEAVEQERARQAPCWPFAGTLRGYNIHLRSYTDCCVPCERIRREYLDAPLVRLGLDPKGMINERS